jgi:hypothetical protein
VDPAPTGSEVLFRSLTKPSRIEDIGRNVDTTTTRDIANLGAAPGNLTLQQAINLRTALGDEWERSKDPTSSHFLDPARREPGDAISRRFADLGQKRIWDYRNKKSEASYDIPKL